jgi:hypothetical protein
VEGKAMKEYASFNRFDICEAWYLYAMDYHTGQWSKEYKIFGRLDRMKFKPSLLFSCVEDLTDNGKIIFFNLVEGHSRVN